MLSDYRVPPYFEEDLFHLVGEHRRPPYRWLLWGPRRSGTGVHVDPLATSAWNALISGRKRWVLFPPDVPRDIVRPRMWRRPGEDDEPIDYFNTLLPRLLDTRPDVAARTIEFIQLPGDTVFVPGGWWHAVLNLEDSVAITQNYASGGNWERVWPAVRQGRPGMARKLLRAIRVARPELAARADVLNAAVDWEEGAETARHAARVAADKQRRAARRARRAAAAARTALRAADGNDSDATASSASSVSSSSTSSRSSSSSGSATSSSSSSSSSSPAPASTAPPSTAAAPCTAELHKKGVEVSFTRDIVVNCSRHGKRRPPSPPQQRQQLHERSLPLSQGDADKRGASDKPIVFQHDKQLPEKLKSALDEVGAQDSKNQERIGSGQPSGTKRRA